MMHNSKNANQKHYFLTIDEEEVLTILEKSAIEKILITIWTTGKSKIEEYQVENADIDSKRLMLIPQGGLLSKLSISQHANKNIFLKIGKGKFQYFTYTKFHYDQETKKYWIYLKDDIYKTQQRTDYRLEACSFHKIQFKIDNENIFNGLDISAGGTSFCIKADTRDHFEKDTVFRNCTLKFNQTKYTIPRAKVVGLWEQKDITGNTTNEVKIGISFEKLPKATEEALFKHINTGVRHNEMKKKKVLIEEE